ncbi:MAG: divergent polysaccharide deacetylase family protein [Bilophila wadsworthia]
MLTESPGKLPLATKGVLTHEIWFEATTDAFPILPPTDKAPRLTIVMNELGGDKAVTASLLALKLPITFSVLPFAKDAAATATAAHEAGQEVLVDMPMETMQCPSSRRARRNHHEDVRGRHADPDGRRPRPCALRHGREQLYGLPADHGYGGDTTFL